MNFASFCFVVISFGKNSLNLGLTKIEIQYGHVYIYKLFQDWKDYYVVLLCILIYHYLSGIMIFWHSTKRKVYLEMFC